MLLHVFIDHFLSWVNLPSALICQITEIVVRNEPLLIRIYILKAAVLIFKRNFNFECFEPLSEFIEGNLVFEVYVEEPECLVQLVEPLV